MQFWLDVVDPPCQNFTGTFCHVTPAIQPISIQLLQTQQKPRVTDAHHNAEKHYLLVNYINLNLGFWASVSYDQRRKFVNWNLDQF